MKKLTNIFCLLLVVLLTFSLSGCKIKDKEDDKAQAVIKKYLTTYYTVDNNDITTYKNIISGTKDIFELDVLTKAAGENFIPLMTDAAYHELTASRMSYGRIKGASDEMYYVTVKNIKLTKDSEDKEKKVRVYYYEIELTKNYISGNKSTSVSDKKQIAVSKINDDWKVEHFSATDGYSY
jgi:hypothetical protein